jgi:ribonuclease D
MEKDAQFWLKRPMSDDMLNYAREDVRNLITVHRQLKGPMTQGNVALVMKYSQQYVDQFR